MVVFAEAAEAAASIDWIAVTREFGVPVALLLGLAMSVIGAISTIWMGMSRVVKWLGREFVVPLRIRIVTFFDDHTQWMRSLQEDVGRFRIQYEKHDEWERGQALERAQKVTVLNTLINDLAKRVDKVEGANGENPGG